MSKQKFEKVRQVSLTSTRKLGTAVLMMGLALTASARDGIKAMVASGPDKAPSNSVRPRTPQKLNGKVKRWFQIGIASWYGAHFQGHTTAAGEKFDMNQMTCAHPTLPMGTWLRVTNLKNRKTAFVRVNDRGPLVEGRIVDLSFAAAHTLGLAGIGQVRLDPVRNGDPVLAKALVAQIQMPLLFDPVIR